MKELPDNLHNAVVDGLTMLLALRLTGTPAVDTVQATAQAWSVALAHGKQWDEAQDIKRIQTAFVVLSGQAKRWPSPSDLLDCMPPRPERLKLEYRHQPTPAQKAAAKQVMAQINAALAKAPCMQRDWIHGPRSRSVDECRRIYAARQKGKK
ncbi:hypothetical protein [Neisseria montereyensis]|uniref:Uncharacterized protein n=1 Tax=Neisseria montereyensis TaxID=2973938 RepID=A0ABT2FFM6_9NEIS|nr:hypothetical protein [Neisseria montereyensis]MCS4534270.1 hypothetical protein [Neisseria montereyensis]